MAVHEMTIPHGPLDADERPRVLIAEDEGLLAEELRHRLTRLGADVVGVAARGEDALALAGRYAPHLAFLDIRLKGDMDGIETAAAMADRFRVPVVFLTAHSDDATIARATRVGPYAYLLKPVNERELKVTLAMVLHKRWLELQLRASELRYQTTLMSIGDGVVSTDPQGRVTFINPVAEALMRWPVADVIGRPSHEVFVLRSADSGEPIPDPVARALTERAIITLPADALLVAQDGSELAVDDSVAPICDSDGSVRGAVAVFRVKTQDARTLERLRQAEDRLRQAEKLEALGRLAGGVAHDINNMMTVVLGCADLVLDTLPPSHASRALLQELKTAADRSTGMVRQLLAFSRKQILAPVSLDVRDAIGDLEVMLRRLIEAHIEITYHLADQPCRVRVDRTQLEQVLINLTLNARDAMPSGGRLSIACESVDVDAAYATGSPGLVEGAYVLVSVSDTGFGMDAVTRSRIFEPFFTTKELGKGTGLGLATVYGAIKQSGGHVSVYSELGEGAVFKVYLPRDEDVALLPGAGLREPQVAGGHETVLLVEDEDGVRDIVTAYLRGAGYTVLAAIDGRDAEQILTAQQRPVDLLLTDVIMPHVSGRELVARLRQRQPGLKVLFMSGYTEDRILRQGMAGERMAFVQKPFSAATILASVRGVLDQP